MSKGDIHRKNEAFAVFFTGKASRIFMKSKIRLDKIN